MSTRVASNRQHKIRHKSVWFWLFDTTLGNVFRLIWWSLAAILVSVLIEWAGMIWFWGPDHSQNILEQETSYLSTYNKNLLTGMYPKDLGVHFISGASRIVSVLHLREFSDYFANGFSAFAEILYFGVNAFINTIFIFAVRGAICVSALTGFALVGLVAFIDGLVERDIRKACGGIESAMVYHRAKRILIPVLFLSFGGYLTAPVSIHPTLVFMPVMAVFALALFVTAKSFKKFL